MVYLFICAHNYIIETYANGDSMWRSIKDSIKFILTHPNGWEDLQQQQIHHATEITGLIPGENEHVNQIHLLTEGEVSLHFCVTNMLMSDSLSRLPIMSTDDLEEEAEEELGHWGVVAIIDAGGGMIDLSSYSVKLFPIKELNEIAPVGCKASRLISSHFLNIFL